MKSVASKSAIVVAVSAAFLSACAPQPGPNSFSSSEANRAVPVQFGTVESARGVEIRAGQTRIGAIAGAIIGGVAGSQIGSSTAANVIGGTAGAVAGGAAGNAIEGSQRTNGVEITIRLDSGEMVAVVQPGDPRDFRRGDRVRVSGYGDSVRVTR